MQNRTGTLIGPNVEEKGSRAKIPTGVLPGGPGNLRTRARALKVDLLGIRRNHTGTPIGQNDEYLKRSRRKIITGALPGEPGN